MTRVKICGIRRLEDALLARAAGADYLGLVFAPSPRRVTGAEAARIRAATAGEPPLVGVFAGTPVAGVVATARAAGLAFLQLHGDYAVATLRAIADTTGLPLIRALRAGVDDPIAALAGQPYALLLDTPDRTRHGGTGRTFDWSIAAPVAGQVRVFLAGGLTALNVGSAIATARPFAVDVSSGVELGPGRKDPERVRAFMAAVRAADLDDASGDGSAG